jgi:hypothetical protein
MVASFVNKMLSKELPRKSIRLDAKVDHVWNMPPRLLYPERSGKFTANVGAQFSTTAIFVENISTAMKAKATESELRDLLAVLTATRNGDPSTCFHHQPVSNGILEDSVQGMLPLERFVKENLSGICAVHIRRYNGAPYSRKCSCFEYIGDILVDLTDSSKL